MMDLVNFTKIVDKDITWEGLKKILVEQNLLLELSNILFRITVFLNKDAEIVYINKFFENTLGYDLKKIQNKKIVNYFASKKSTTEFAKNWKSMTGRPHKLFIQEIPIYTSKKGERIINWHFLPIYLNNNFKIVFCVGEDMTDAVMLEKELLLKCSQLEEKNKKLSSVIKKLIDREIEMKKIKEQIKNIKSKT